MPTKESASDGVRVPRRIASVIMNSLKGGVVPRVGLPYITVGREVEIEALLRDLELVSQGGASFRFVVGRYGSGKSFLLQTIRNHAMGRNFVVADADLTPERRLQGTKGQGLATYRELISNLSTKTRPEGGALTLVLDRWISNVQQQVAASGVDPSSPEFPGAVERCIQQAVEQLHDLVHGFDFARLLTMYYRAHVEGDDRTKASVVKWFRGEYRTRSEARAELGVSVAISDDDWYDYLKLFAQFFKGAGYEGLIVLIDELVNLYKIPNQVARQYNYEKVLAMYNDALQGKARNLGVIMSGTPQAVEDRRRGLYSYEALRSRLTQGRFGGQGYADMFAPVITLQPLTNEELLVLTEKLADIHAGLLGYERRLGDDDLVEFLRVEMARVGAQTHVTPREITRDFIELLDIMYQHPQVGMAQLMGSEEFERATPPLPGEGAAIGGGGPDGGPAAPGAPGGVRVAPGAPPAGRDFAEFSI
ncbi:MAG: ATP-binding protein [Coriobacteriales bacterium]